MDKNMQRPSSFIRSDPSFPRCALPAESGAEEVLVVAFHAFDGGIDDFKVGGFELAGGSQDTVDGELTCGGFANDAAFAYVFAAGFKLGFDEENNGSLPGV